MGELFNEVLDQYVALRGRAAHQDVLTQRRRKAWDKGGIGGKAFREPRQEVDQEEEVCANGDKPQDASSADMSSTARGDYEREEEVQRTFTIDSKLGRTVVWHPLNEDAEMKDDQVDGRSTPANISSSGAQSSQKLRSASSATLEAFEVQEGRQDGQPPSRGSAGACHQFQAEPVEMTDVLKVRVANQRLHAEGAAQGAVLGLGALRAGIILAA